MVITTDEESIIQNSSVNSGKYEKQKTSVEDRFFQTIKDYGGLPMSDLLIFVRHGLTIDRETKRSELLLANVSYYVLLSGRI
jgi:hypothetical protein